MTVTLSASDTGGSGVDETYYTTDGSAPSTSSPIYNSSSKPVLTSDGQTIKYFSTDKAGNEESAHSATAHIDNAAPSSGATSAQLDNTGTIAVDAHASDASPSSGVASVDLYVKKPGDSSFSLAHTNSDGSSAFNYTVPLDENEKPVNGDYSFYTIAHDNAGNDEAAKTSAESTTLEDTVAPGSGATSAQLDDTGTIAVDAHASDASPSSGVASVDLYVKKPGDSSFSLAHTNSDGSSAFNYTVPLDENEKPVNGDYHGFRRAPRGDARADDRGEPQSRVVHPGRSPRWLRYLHGDYDLSRSSMEPVVDLNGDLEEGRRRPRPRGGAVGRRGDRDDHGRSGAYEARRSSRRSPGGTRVRGRRPWRLAPGASARARGDRAWCDATEARARLGEPR